MNIALLGYGKMGQALYRIAGERGHSFPVIVDPHAEIATHKELTAQALEGVDVVIDFSLGDAAISNAKICNEAGVNLVVGSTGWYDQMEAMKAAVPDIGCLWSSNFSIGVNLYLKMLEYAAGLINKFDEYDIWGTEIHHHNKADSPSGTAKTISQILLDNIDRKTAVVEEKLDRKIEPNEIHFSSTRGGPVNFGHTIGFDSAADTITITHSARNRDGYALGAVKAAEWLAGKKGFHDMKDFLSL